MNDTSARTAEQRLEQFFLLPLVEREASWAEISEELERNAELEARKRPAPVTLQA